MLARFQRSSALTGAEVAALERSLGSNLKELNGGRYARIEPTLDTGQPLYVNLNDCMIIKRAWKYFVTKNGDPISLYTETGDGDMEYVNPADESLPAMSRTALPLDVPDTTVLPDSPIRAAFTDLC